MLSGEGLTRVWDVQSSNSGPEPFILKTSKRIGSLKYAMTTFVYLSSYI
jgi:hypothetical protein